MKTKDELPDCPVATTVQLIGSKWKLLILRNLLARPWRFNEARKCLPTAFGPWRRTESLQERFILKFRRVLSTR